MNCSPAGSAITLSWVTALLQTSDALFPTGAYAHSLGFEEAVRLGMVRDEQGLGAYLTGHAAMSLTALDMPYLRFSFEAQPLELPWLDAELGASKLAAETRAASAQLGQRRLKALLNIFPDVALLTACSKAIASGQMAGHHAIVCGLQAVVLNIPLEAALGAYYYQGMAAIGSASLKLLRIGQDGVQRALRAACEDAQSAIAASMLVAREDAGWFDPLVEIAGMRHENAVERLFIS